MKVSIATDHNGVVEKQELINFLNELNVSVLDCSTNNTPTDDYPDFAEVVAKNVATNQSDLGILLCGTGIGMSIAANKVKGIRCAKVSSVDEARLSKEHNNANIIALSYKENMDVLKEMIKTFIETPFSNEERHARRVEKINKLED